MSVSFDPSQYDLPADALINVIEARETPANRSSVIEQLRGLIEKNRGEQNAWVLRFELLYDEARRSNWSEPFLIQWAAALLEKQRAALERFHPLIEGLRQRAADYASRPDPELLGLCRSSIDLILGWITPYQTLCAKLLRLASQRSDEVMRARPIDGEIDYSELSREHIARYPKIRAALAK